MYQSVKELRESLKINQLDMANRLGVSLSTISAVETGRVDLSKELKEKLETTYNVELNIVKKSKEVPEWVNELVLRMEADWKKENEFLKSQLERKDKLIDALTEKFLKDEVSNWPPMFPINGSLGLETEVQLRVA